MSLTVASVEAEFGKYLHGYDLPIKDWVYRSTELDAHTTPITKVKGEYPGFYEVAGHLVQEFMPVWNELGTIEFLPKKLESFRQKVNFRFVPASVLNSWLAYLYKESLKPEQMPISLWVMEKVKQKVIDDLAILEGTGTYTAGTGQFGDSMDGLITVLMDMLNSRNPFRVPLNALTDENIVDEITRYERMLPNRTIKKEYPLFLSEENYERYQLRYERQFGTKVTYGEGDRMKSHLKKKPMVGLECLNGSDLIFCTPKENFLQLIDVNDKPKLVDVQKQDYAVKLFMEWVLGYNFWVDEMVCISDFGGTERGLANMHAKFYPEIDTAPIS